MNITSTFRIFLNNSEPPLQESGSLLGKVVTKVHATTSCVISSIGFVAQSILSNFIYVGTLGRYTLDDLKGYFSIKGTLENSNSSSKINEDSVQPELNERDSLTSIGDNTSSPQAIALRAARFNLKRNDSRTSLKSDSYKILRSHPEPELYPDLSDMYTLSTHLKTGKQRLVGLEREMLNRTNKGK